MWGGLRAANVRRSREESLPCSSTVHHWQNQPKMFLLILLPHFVVAWLGVLVLAGTELIFFIAACMVLCFGLVTKTVSITTQGCVSCWEQCLHSIKDFPASPVALPVRGLGWTGGWEGTWPGQLTPAGRRDIPYGMTSCPAVKAGGGVSLSCCFLGTSWVSVVWWTATVGFCITPFSWFCFYFCCFVSFFFFT